MEFAKFYRRIPIFATLCLVGITTINYRQAYGLFYDVTVGKFKEDGSPREVRIVTYTGSNVNNSEGNYFSIENDLYKEPLLEYLDLSLPTVLYCHGYIEYQVNESVRTVVGAYHQRGGWNVLAVDWSDFANLRFINSAMETRNVGRKVARVLEILLNNSLSLETLHIVGHSLGAHVAGYIALYLPVKLPRITGLDPALPLFYPGFRHLEPTDARIVDAIHTDGGFYGVPTPTGTVDYFPNGGHRRQPGCPTIISVPLSDTDLCHHWRSWRFWAESILDPEAFLAVECSSEQLFNSGMCSENPTAYIGLTDLSNVSGSYYLCTNSKSPFGKGESGVNCK